MKQLATLISLPDLAEQEKQPAQESSLKQSIVPISEMEIPVTNVQIVRHSIIDRCLML